MDLYSEILIHILHREEMYVTFPNLKICVNEIIGTECYRALQKIKAIIENDSLDDFKCVEQIVCVLEDIGSDGGNRHDFG